MTQNKVNIDLSNKTILITGGAGFVGAALIMRLLKESKASTIVNIDNVNNFYDTKLKQYRLDLIENAAKESSVNYVFIKGGIADTPVSLYGATKRSNELYAYTYSKLCSPQTR